ISATDSGAKQHELSMYLAVSCVRGNWLENLHGPIKLIRLRERKSHVTTSNGVEASAVAHHCRVGLLTELPASFFRGDSSGEIILVRFHRLRSWRQQAG